VARSIIHGFVGPVGNDWKDHSGIVRASHRRVIAARRIVLIHGFRTLPKVARLGCHNGTNGHHATWRADAVQMPRDSIFVES
jgi:hypothetical protein